MFRQAATTKKISQGAGSVQNIGEVSFESKKKATSTRKNATQRRNSLEK